MYFKLNGVAVEEGFDPEASRKTQQPVQQPSNKFPLWLLLLLVAIIVGAGFWFLLRLKQQGKGSNFGFQFY